MTKILMVCLGNICRSPLAEGILKSKLPKEFEIDSAGTGNWHEGENPDNRSINVAKKFGIDISYQHARQIKNTDFDYYDILYVMDKNNYDNVIALCKKEAQKQKVKLILDESSNVDKTVPDPYYGSEEDFIHVFHLLDDVCTIIAKKLTHG